MTGKPTDGTRGCGCPGVIGPHDTDEAMWQRIAAANADLIERIAADPTAHPLYRGATAVEVEAICAAMHRFTVKLISDPERAMSLLREIGAIIDA